MRISGMQTKIPVMMIAVVVIIILVNLILFLMITARRRMYRALSVSKGAIKKRIPS
jgi:flagellar biosynthesis/type III secretory pathway M-ring protein FliF/YscJ